MKDNFNNILNTRCSRQCQWNFLAVTTKLCNIIILFMTWRVEVKGQNTINPHMLRSLQPLHLDLPSTVCVHENMCSLQLPSFIRGAWEVSCALFVVRCWLYSKHFWNNRHRKKKLSAVTNNFTSSNFPNKGMGHNLGNQIKPVLKLLHRWETYTSRPPGIQTLWSTCSETDCRTHGPKNSIMPGKRNKTNPDFFIVTVGELIRKWSLNIGLSAT